MNLKIKNKSFEYLNNNFNTRLYNMMKRSRSDNNNNNNNSILLYFYGNSTALGPITK
jgi:hypothetical protein